MVDPVELKSYSAEILLKKTNLLIMHFCWKFGIRGSHSNIILKALSVNQTLIMSSQAHQEQMINSAREILDRIDLIRQAAKEEPQNLGHLV